MRFLPFVFTVTMAFFLNGVELGRGHPPAHDERVRRGADQGYGGELVHPVGEPPQPYRVRLFFGVPRPGIDLYANYQHYPGLDGIADVEDIDSFVVGARVEFN